MQNGYTSQAYQLTLTKLKVFIQRHKGFIIEKIYIQRIKRKLRSTFSLLLNLDLLLFFTKSRKYNKKKHSERVGYHILSQGKINLHL